MPLVETLTDTIGPSIAKAIIKLWLKDSPLLADVIPELLDPFKGGAAATGCGQRAAARYERQRGQQREVLRQAELLFETLLHRAFRGELVGMGLVV